MPNPKGPKIGRPALPDDKQAMVLGRLLMLTPRTAAYRQARRTLAVELDRTERAIDTIFENLKRRFLEEGGARDQSAA